MIVNLKKYFKELRTSESKWMCFWRPLRWWLISQVCMDLIKVVEIAYSWKQWGSALENTKRHVLFQWWQAWCCLESLIQPESPSQPKSEIEQAWFNWKMKWKQQLSLDPASSVVFCLMSKVEINGSMKLESYFVFDAVLFGQVGGFCISGSGIFLYPFSSYLLPNISTSYSHFSSCTVYCHNVYGKLKCYRDQCLVLTWVLQLELGGFSVHIDQTRLALELKYSQNHGIMKVGKDPYDWVRLSAQHCQIHH